MAHRTKALIPNCRERAVDSAKDVSERDFVRRSRQYEPAIGTALAAYKSGTLEFGHDAAQELEWDALRLSEMFCGDGSITRIGKFGHRPNGVIDARLNAHGRSLARK